MNTISGLLSSQARQRGSKTAFIFLDKGEREKSRLSYAQLDEEARAVAARLRSNYGKGDRALILTSDNTQFIRAFMGCQHAGVIAVPVALPTPIDSKRRLATLRAIVADSGANVVLTDLPACPWPDDDELSALDWLPVHEVATAEAEGFHPERIDPEDISFLQYTSGSTSLPKGVVVPHRALIQNEELFSLVTSMTPDDVLVSWLPLFHDMGLIGKVLQTVYAGAHAVLMSSLAFAQRPARWLRVVSDYRGTFTGAPNFAFELCVQRIPAADRETFDLSSLRVIFSGAEPIRPATLEAFAEAFAPSGLDRRALVAGYGLAEVTLLACCSEIGTGVKVLDVDRAALQKGVLEFGGDQQIVSCGRAKGRRRVEIVDPVTCESVPDGSVGEIWLAGPDVAAGYWRLPEISERIFEARITGSDDGPFLRTGDLGLIHAGELFVTGRYKDVIIIGGRNLYPQDLELTAESVDRSIRKGGTAAFGLDLDGRERLVIVVEVRPFQKESGETDLTALAWRVRSAIAAEHGVQPDDVALVAPGSVPKTSSGKIQRGACRAAYERGELRLAADRRKLAGAQ
jgi:nonribosomal peptide synthetase protein BlmVI